MIIAEIALAAIVVGFAVSIAAVGTMLWRDFGENRKRKAHIVPCGRGAECQSPAL